MLILTVLGGLILLGIGGELLVRGAVGVSRAIGISPLLVGLVIVGFGTSTPELATSLFAALEGAPGIAVGNVVGSNIANILLILGITALIAPLAIEPAAFRRDGLALVGATLACIAAVLIGMIDRAVGVGLILVLVGYLAWTYRAERRAPDLEAQMHELVAADTAPTSAGFGTSFVFAVGGIGITVFGAKLLVGGAIDIARISGMSETLIGLTIVAAGTSLPELVACIMAALRRHADVALGNVIGSNIFNALGILGLTATVHPIRVPADIARLDIWVMAGATASLMLFLRTGWTVKRWEGAILVLLYVGYLVALTLVS